MAIRVGINGFGRIGQTFLRVAISQLELDVEVVAINDIAPIDTLAYSLKKDTIRGNFNGTIEAVSDVLIVNGKPIRVFKGAEPANIPWHEAAVDVVVESTGAFRTGAAARAHITKGGVRKVVISASADDPDAFLVYGANEKQYDPDRHHVISPASCGVNALAMMAKVLFDSFAIYDVSTTVVLAAQGWQKIHDAVSHTSRNDPRLGRSMSQNIIPHSHVVGDLLTTALPGLGKVLYSYYVVPTPIGSLALLSAKTDEPISVARVNQAMREAATGYMKGLLDYDDDPIVSSDVKGNSASCLFDPSNTQTTSGGGIKVMGWFDGEWGFSSRLVDLVRLVGQPYHQPSELVRAYASKVAIYEPQAA
jgi:glyceraldehyde 3-phosphate dehydrogenase